MTIYREGKQLGVTIIFSHHQFLIRFAACSKSVVFIELDKSYKTLLCV